MPSFVRGAGDLKERVHLQARTVASDGFGGSVPGGPFQTQCTVRAHLQPLKGSEAVQAARLQGRQPYILTIRQSSQTRPLNTAWQVVDARNVNRKFAVVAPPTDPDSDRAWLEVMIVEGGQS